MPTLNRVPDPARVSALARRILETKLDDVRDRMEKGLERAGYFLIDPAQANRPIVEDLASMWADRWSQISVGLLATFEGAFDLKEFFNAGVRQISDLSEVTVLRNAVGLVRIHADGSVSSISRDRPNENKGQNERRLSMYLLSQIDSLVLTAYGIEAASTIVEMVDGPIGSQGRTAVQHLRMHRDACCVLDSAACEQLQIEMSYLPLHVRRAK